MATRWRCVCRTHYVTSLVLAKKNMIYAACHNADILKFDLFRARQTDADQSWILYMPKATPCVMRDGHRAVLSSRKNRDAAATAWYRTRYFVLERPNAEATEPLPCSAARIYSFLRPIAGGKLPERSKSIPTAIVRFPNRASFAISERLEKQPNRGLARTIYSRGPAAPAISTREEGGRALFRKPQQMGEPCQRSEIEAESFEDSPLVLPLVCSFPFGSPPSFFCVWCCTNS